MYRQISPKTARRYLRTLQDPDAVFITADREELANLFDLYSYLKSCAHLDFRGHVNGSKNDFSDWVRDVILDDELADKMGTCVIKHPMQHRLLVRINFLASAASNKLSGRDKSMIILEDAVTPEEHFVTADGRTLRNLWELYAFLKETDYPTITKHVSEGRNDIADWVDDVVLDHELADRLRTFGDHFGMMFTTAWRLNQLEKNAGNHQAHIQDYSTRAVNAVKS